MTDPEIQTVWSGIGMVILGIIFREFPLIGEASYYLIVTGIILLAVGIFCLIYGRPKWT